MSKDGGPAFPLCPGRGVFFDHVAASIAYKYADAMLAERDKNK